MTPKKTKEFRNVKKKKYSKGVSKPGYIEKAILRTLAYAAIFDCSLSFYQLSHYLINKNKITPGQLKSALDDLLEKKIVLVKKGKYYLSGKKVVSWDSRAKTSKELIEKAWDISQILKKIPWVKFIGVTGSVAAFNGRKDDDIDVLIITQKNRVWLTRGFVYLLLILMGEIHRHGKNDRKICPNIFLDESKLAWGKKSRNLYTAREVLLVYPLFDRELGGEGSVYCKFLNANKWAFEDFGNVFLGDFGFGTKIKKDSENILFAGLEKLARVLQLKYMDKKKTTEVTKKDLIHFNLDDATEGVLNKYDELCREYV